MSDERAELAALAARLVVEEGMEYAAAKRKAAQALGARRGALPDNEAVEDAVREHIALFCADTQPTELRALREAALRWMGRLEAFRPHLSGAVWRGTATRLSSVHIDLYCDDPKMAELALINAGVSYDSGALDKPGQREPKVVLSLSEPDRQLGEPITVHLVVHDLQDQRGALRPDARGRSWRGDRTALQHLLESPP